MNEFITEYAMDVKNDCTIMDKTPQNGFVSMNEFITFSLQSFKSKIL